MRRLMIIGGVLAIVFLATFGIGVALGVFQADRITDWLAALRGTPGGRWVIVGAVVGLLAADIALGVPATPIMIAAGHLLGPWWGGAASAIGATLAGVIGYAACRALGRTWFDKHVSADDARRLEHLLDRYGLLAMVLIRGLPILPEVFACLAGLGRVRAVRFIVVYAIATVPWAVLHAIAGHASSFTHPWPALLILIGLPAAAWAVGWRHLRRGLDRSREC